MSGPGFDFLSCGCANCRDELTHRFCQIVHRTWDVAEEKNLELLAERLQIHYNAASLSERLAAYTARRNQR